MNNKMIIKFDSNSQNEAFARNVIASFILPLNPSVGELSDIKTAVSEAVTNAIVHAYPDAMNFEYPQIYISVRLYTGRELSVEVSDSGIGIEDVVYTQPA